MLLPPETCIFANHSTYRDLSLRCPVPYMDQDTSLHAFCEENQEMLHYIRSLT